jgi:hypothetical protein
MTTRLSNHAADNRFLAYNRITQLVTKMHRRLDNDLEFRSSASPYNILSVDRRAARVRVQNASEVLGESAEYDKWWSGDDREEKSSSRRTLV